MTPSADFTFAEASPPPTAAPQRHPWQRMARVLAYGAVIAVGLALGGVVGWVVAVMTGLLPFSC